MYKTYFNRKLAVSAIFFAFFLILAKNLFAQTSNVIKLENAKPGTSGWAIVNPVSMDTWRAFDPAIPRTVEVEGYASHTSVNRGETISFYVNTSEPTFDLAIYRMGWYGGTGARQVWPLTGTGVSLPGNKQIIPSPDPITGMVECNWQESYRLTIPKTTDKTDFATGAYIVKLTAGVSGKQSYIPFIVRDDESRSTYVFQSTVNTAQAYNSWGGKSLYAHNSKGAPAQKVSFNRPYGQEQQLGDGWFFNWEIYMLRFLEREGYDVSYLSNIDLHQNGNALLTHKALLMVGHDEYWTYQMKDAVHKARDSGVHLGFFSANESYWQIRLEPSKAGQANRTIVSYKDSAKFSDPYATDIDKTNDKFITTRFRDLKTVFGVDDTIAQPENGLIGTMYHGDPFHGDIVVSDATSWIYAGSGASNGTRLPGLLGYETNAIADNGYSPPNLRVVANSYDLWGGSQVVTYTAPSGSVTFSTSSMQWNWGLDGLQWNWPVPGVGYKCDIRCLSPVAQQVTRNVLARFALPPLPVPTSVVASPADQKIYLSWKTTVGAISYNIYRSLTPKGEGYVPYRSGISSNAFLDTGVTNGTTYYYQVTAVNGAAESTVSDEVYAKPLPASPTALQSERLNKNRIRLSWTQSASDGITGNKVYRSTSMLGPFLPVATLSSTTIYTDNVNNSGVNIFYYAVTALKGTIESSLSNITSQTVDN